MKYEKNNNNFLRKHEQKIADEVTKKLEDIIENYKNKILDLEEKLEEVSQELNLSQGKIATFKANMETPALPKDVSDKINDLENSLIILNDNIASLELENIELQKQTVGYKEHVQMLYIILLLLYLI